MMMTIIMPMRFVPQMMQYNKSNAIQYACKIHLFYILIIHIYIYNITFIMLYYLIICYKFNNNLYVVIKL